MKLKIKKGDLVAVISGESKGSQGRVVSVDREKLKAVVEGVNIISRHTKPSASNPQGSIVKREAPVHISNLMLVDPSTKKPARVGTKVSDNGSSERFFKKSRR